MEEQGQFIRHTSCPSCDSSDGRAIYEKEDGTLDSFCWSCEKYFPPDKTNIEELEEEDLVDSLEDIDMTEDFSDILSLDVRGFKERRTKIPANQVYGIRSKLDGSGNILERFYPNTREGGNLVGFKKRTVEGKKFTSIGSVKQTNEFFGQSAFQAGGKFLVIVEGEEDCPAAWQMLKSDQYETPVVSPTCGASSLVKQIKANYDFVSSFEKVIFMLDNDEPGQEAAEKASKILKPGQAYIADMKYKDACDYNKKGKAKEFKNAFWKARRYSPVDVKSLGALWDDFETSGEEEILGLPPEFQKLIEMMAGGPAMGEVTVIGALTSIGKSSLLNRMVYYWALTKMKRCGLMYLEGTPKELVRDFLTMYKGINLALKQPSELDMDSLKEDFKRLVGDDDKILNVNHNGSFKTVDEMFEKIRWMIKVAGCEVLVIDPLQAAVPNNDNAVIDQFMDSLLKLAKETNAAIIVVSHMRKPSDDDPHDVNEYDLKGSSAISQIAFNTILLSRDKNSPDPLIRNSTKIHLPKCRRTGETGDAGWILYDSRTGKISKGVDPYDEDEEEVPEQDFEDQGIEEENFIEDEEDDSPPW